MEGAEHPTLRGVANAVQDMADGIKVWWGEFGAELFALQDTYKLPPFNADGMYTFPEDELPIGKVTAVNEDGTVMVAVDPIRTSTPEIAHVDTGCAGCNWLRALECVCGDDDEAPHTHFPRPTQAEIKARMRADIEVILGDSKAEKMITDVVIAHGELLHEQIEAAIDFVSIPASLPHPGADPIRTRDLAAGAVTSAKIDDDTLDEEYDNTTDGLVKCEDCKGSGEYVGLCEKINCPTCYGSGWV